MSSIPIVDSHLHLWDSHLPRKWLGGLPSLNIPHIPSTVDEELKISSKISSSFVPPSVEAIVYVETDVPAAYALLEAEWVANLSLQDKRIQGIVAHAPLEDGEDVRTYLAALKQIGEGEGRKLVKGVRRLIQSESPEFCLQPSFVAGVKLLQEYDLSFDICCRPQHLENVIKLVAQCPNVNFVLDHMGKPTISPSDPGLEHWKNNISNLARLPNVYCKLSGIVTEAQTSTGPSWKPEDLHKYTSHVLQVFGTSRVMFGSDWPVVKLAGVGYTDWLDIATTITASLSQEDKVKVWNANAKKFYKL